MRGFVDAPELDPYRLVAIQALLVEVLPSAIAAHARSYSSPSATSYRSSTRDRELATSELAIYRDPSEPATHALGDELRPEDLTELEHRFRSLTGSKEWSVKQRGLWAARARDLGPAELWRRVEARYRVTDTVRDLMRDIERPNWDAGLPDRRPRPLDGARDQVGRDSRRQSMERLGAIARRVSESRTEP